MDLIATKGFEGLRYQEVAKEAGINNATLFYHFSTKEELIQGVMQHLGEEFRKTPDRPAGTLPTALEELRLEFESVGALLQEQPKLFLVLTEISLRALRDPVIESGSGERISGGRIKPAATAIS
jgi:AcrR family transcriptional regulator